MRLIVEPLRVEQGRDGELGSQLPICQPKLTKVPEAKNKIAPPTGTSQPVLDFCPSPNKHFFCGMARKLGCQFCAPK